MVLPGVAALVIRSATRVDADVLAAAVDLVVVGRAGIGLDNVDVANCGIVQVENGAILDLKGVTIAGGILNTAGEPYGDGGAIHVLG